MKVVVTDKIHDFFRERNIFEARSWTGVANTPATYTKRWETGKEIDIGTGCIVEEFSCFAVDRHIHTLGSFSDIASQFPINSIVGRHCSIAPGCTFVGFRHPMQAVTSTSMVYRPGREFVNAYLKTATDRNGRNPYRAVATPQPQDQPLVVGNDVWIGDHVVLRGGIRINSGAVIAGHSVLTKSVGSFEIWGGNPARFIKLRFPREIVDRLIESHWWDYDMADLYGLDFERPESFLDQFDKRRGELKPHAGRLFDICKEIKDYL